MKVSELISFLQKQPQELLVAFRFHSCYDLLSEDEIRIEELCFPTSSGWIEDKRPDKPSQEYLVFPGN